MATKVNYDDNLFYVGALIRTLDSGIRLELDADYFQDKLVEDILFLDRTIQQVYEGLRVNAFLIGRAAHLRELMRTKHAFAELIQSIVSGEPSFSVHLQGFLGQLQAVEGQHTQDINDILSLMTDGKTEEDPQNIVSQDEYRFLFQNDEPDT